MLPVLVGVAKSLSVAAAHFKCNYSVTLFEKQGLVEIF